MLITRGRCSIVGDPLCIRAYGYSLSGCLEIAVNTQLFQHVRDAGEGISTDALAEKTGITVPVLVRIMRHFVASSVVKFSKSKGWQPTELSKALAAENYQHSILFCQRAATSFKGFPEHFKSAGYKPPGLTNGPFQSAHKTDLPFFHWLGATPPFVDYFASFMSVYRASQLDWWQFYPVAESLTVGFDKWFDSRFCNLYRRQATYLPLLNDRVDPPYNVVILGVWGLIEQNVVIMAASIPTLRPFFRHIRKKGPFTTPTSYIRSGNNTKERRTSVSELPLEQMKVNMARGSRRSFEMHNSSEELHEEERPQAAARW